MRANLNQAADIRTGMYRFGEFEVDAGKLQVRRAGDVLELEPKAIRVLLYLLERRERVVSKDELIEKVWDGIEVTDNALTRVVGQLRKALGDDPKNAQYIETIPTVGYRFVGVIEEKAAVAGGGGVFRWGWAVVLAVVLMAVGFASWRAKAKGIGGIGGPAVAKFRQITNSRTLDSGPALSPDGRWLAYSSDRSGQFEIYVRYLDGPGKEIQITNDGGPNVEAAWSPDGNWIAYHCVVRGGICMVPATGGTVRELASPGSQPSWSPDSKKIVYWASTMISSSPLDLFTVMPHGFVTLDIESGEKKEYRDLNGNRSVPVWSADGQWIVYSALPFLGKARIEALRLRDGAVHEVFHVEGLTASLRLSADNRRLYFSKFVKPAGHGLGWVEIDPETMKSTGDVHELLQVPSFPLRLEISRDGRKLIVEAVEQDSNLYRLPLREGAEAAPLTNNKNFRNTMPAVSPDGTKIAYGARQVGSAQQIWIMDADGGNPEIIGREDVHSMVPSWIRNGAALLYRIVPSNIMEEVRIADRTRKQWKLSGRQTTMQRATGREDELLFHVLEQDRLRLGVVNYQTDKVSMIPVPTNDVAFGVMSPDGKRVMAERLESSFSHLVVLPVTGGEVRQLTHGVEHAFTGGWSGDGKLVSFAGLRNGSWNLYTIDPDTGKETKLTNYRSLRSFVRYPVWGPKKDYLVFEKTDTTGNLYLMDLPAH
jgi:Tol biopolymer transport system component/DNA-binding winged helix-turn-helix (wHTH) protein